MSAPIPSNPTQMDSIDLTVESQPSAGSALLTFLGGRKFIFVMVVLALATALCFNGKITDSVYSTIVLGLMASYLASNVYQKKVLAEAGTVSTPTTVNTYNSYPTGTPVPTSSYQSATGQ